MANNSSGQNKTLVLVVVVAALVVGVGLIIWNLSSSGGPDVLETPANPPEAVQPTPPNAPKMNIQKGAKSIGQ